MKGDALVFPCNCEAATTRIKGGAGDDSSSAKAVGRMAAAGGIGTWPRWSSSVATCFGGGAAAATTTLVDGSGADESSDDASAGCGSRDGGPHSARVWLEVLSGLLSYSRRELPS
ncbi:unnamed protein product [Linum trigynum]|uniref:Uncharacterized protein n=1 Tax=Linum trigynum TaxID=586398 RepID=A0AAV2E022_9ROSI